MDSDRLMEQRLTDLECVCRGLSHEASNWLYAVLGQTELADLHLRRMWVALRYADRQIARLERRDDPLLADLPRAAIATLRGTLARRTTRRRLEGIRKARANAQKTSSALQHLHAFAAARETPAATVDLNEAVQAAADLLRLGYYRYQERGPRISFDLSDSLPAVAGSSGLVIGLIIDLAAGEPTEAIHIATQAAGDEAVCTVTIMPAAAVACAAAAAAARLCGGSVAAEEHGDGVTYRVRLPLAEVAQLSRSGSCW